MPIIAKAGTSGFIPPPAGQWAAVCVDVVDLGVLEVTFGGKTKKQHKIRIVWQIDADRPDGSPHLASKRYTLSLHDKAALRKDLESWRANPFANDELEAFDVETVLHAPALLNIMEQKKGDDTYANVTAIMKLPKGMEAPTRRDYVRVVDRKTEAVGESQQQQPDDPFSSEPFPYEDVPF